MSQTQHPKRETTRRRRANVAGGRKHSHRVLVTEFEEARLVKLAEAERVTVPRLLIESALSAQGETPTQRRDAMADLFAVRRALANTASNVNQLAYAANSGQATGLDSASVFAELTERLAAVDEVLEGLREP